MRSYSERAAARGLFSTPCKYENVALVINLESWTMALQHHTDFHPSASVWFSQLLWELEAYGT